MKTLFVFLLCLPLAAQEASPPAPVEINGKVLEEGTGLGVGEVKVSLMRRPDAPTGSPSEVTSIQTDFDGKFQIKANLSGRYFVNAQREGYVEANKGTDFQSLIGASAARQFTVAGKPLTQTISFTMWKMASASGTVIDGATGKGVPRLNLSVLHIVRQSGFYTERGSRLALADDQGSFSQRDLSPGTYAARILPGLTSSNAKTLRFDLFDAPADEVDEDYEDVYWPGGGDLQSVLPMTVTSGADVSLGAVNVRKVPYYRAHISFPSGSCAKGAKFSLFRIQLLPGLVKRPAPLGEVACGQNFSVLGLRPGSYVLELKEKVSIQTRLRALLSIEVANRNLRATVLLQRGVDLSGKLVPAGKDDELPKLAGVGMQLESFVTMDMPDEFIPSSPLDANGRFQFANSPFGEKQLMVFNLPKPYVVRETRLDGKPLLGDMFTWGGQGTLEVVLDRGATIIGTVRNRDKAAPLAKVFLVKQPGYTKNIFVSLTRAQADNDGAFTLDAVAPGQYRLFSVSEETSALVEEPGVLERLLSKAERVDVSAGGSVTLSTNVIDASR